MNQRVDTRRVGIFLGFAFGIAWATALVIFFTGGLTNSPQSMPGLNLALVLLATPELTVRLEGFVDSSTDAAADVKLSASMAQAAAARLRDLGVDPARLGTAGRGSESPLLPNFTARSRAANRRVEVVAPR